jgi:hypothetical protein
MERDRADLPKAEEVQEEDMDTIGQGDKLQAAVDKVAEPSESQPEDTAKRVEEKDMDTRGQGDPKADLLKRP